jgi:mannose-6-phosphate isomerase-like protein (cupin superfamily)
MQTKMISEKYQHLSPAGAEIRLLMDSAVASLVHYTLKQGNISKATTHKTVSEFWHVLSGNGTIWRRQKDLETTALLTPGITIDIPLWTEFQYRSDSGTDLVFLCFTMPKWSGPEESRLVTNGPWKPTVS